MLKVQNRLEAVQDNLEELARLGLLQPCPADTSAKGPVGWSQVQASGHPVIHFYGTSNDDVAAQLLELREKIGGIERAVDRLMGLPQPLVVPISTFAPEPYEFVRPIFAVVEPIVPDDPEEDCTYLARFIEGRVGATGSTVEDAIQCLKEALISKWNLLEKLPKLGKAMRHQKSILQDVIRRCPGEAATK